MLVSLFRSAVMALFLCLPSVVLPSIVLADEAPTFETGGLRIESASGAVHQFSVELAVTDDQRARGLMHRTELAPDAGMLFDFKTVRDVLMWMKDTPLPLDMLFIDAEGVITHIAKRTVPFSEAIISSQGPVHYVLEINGGRSDDLNIAPGDRVVEGLPAQP